MLLFIIAFCSCNVEYILIFPWIGIILECKADKEIFIPGYIWNGYLDLEANIHMLIINLNVTSLSK